MKYIVGVKDKTQVECFLTLSLCFTLNYLYCFFINILLLLCNKILWPRILRIWVLDSTCFQLSHFKLTSEKPISKCFKANNILWRTARSNKAWYLILNINANSLPSLLMSTSHGASTCYSLFIFGVSYNEVLQYFVFGIHFSFKIIKIETFS